MARYRQVADGEPRAIKGKRGSFPHKIMCCDCGLVHVVLLRLTSPNQLELRAWRDNRATKIRRKLRRRAG